MMLCYKSIKPIQCPTSRQWDYTISEAIKIVEKMQLEKLNKKLKSATPKGSIKSKNISPNAMVSLNEIEGLLVAEEAKKEEEAKKKSTKTTKKASTTKKATATSKKTTTKKTTVEVKPKKTVAKPRKKKEE